MLISLFNCSRTENVISYGLILRKPVVSLGSLEILHGEEIRYVRLIVNHKELAAWVVEAEKSPAGRGADDSVPPTREPGEPVCKFQSSFKGC